MEFPEPTIDIDTALRALLAREPVDRELTIAEDLLDLARATWAEMRRDQLKAFLAQAWEEGRWSPPGVCLNPYGAPAQAVAPGPVATLPGAPLTRLRAAAQAALDWVENMAPTIRRTALAEQLRSALEGK